MIHRLVFTLSVTLQKFRVRTAEPSKFIYFPFLNILFYFSFHLYRELIFIIFKFLLDYMLQGKKDKEKKRMTFS